MPYAVSQWPYWPDPRQADWNFLGWDFGQVPPWKWRIDTSGATGIYAQFNDGVLMEPTGFLPEDTRWDNQHVLIGAITVILSIKGADPPVGIPPGITKSIGILMHIGPVRVYGGGLELLWPTAIAVQSPIPMVPVAPSAGTIPNPMSLTPVKWNVDSL
jgi:hypothetical protein